MAIQKAKNLTGNLYDALKSTKKDVKYFSKTYRSRKMVLTCLQQVKRNIYQRCIKQLTDQVYKVYTVHDLQRFLKEDQTDKMQYVAEEFDCDNFAFGTYFMAEIAMPGCCLGVCFVGTPKGAHAVNFFIDENNRFYLIEPQNDEIKTIPKDWYIYFILL